MPITSNKYCADCDEFHEVKNFCGDCGKCIFGNCECLRCGDCDSIEINCKCMESCEYCPKSHLKKEICFDHQVHESHCERYHFPDDPDNQ